MLRVFVDDLRLAPKGWTLARSVSEAIRILANFNVETVSLDHDIALMDETGAFTGKVSPECFQAVAYYIAAMPDNVRPKKVYIHTANPVGAVALAAILEGKTETVRDATFASEWKSMEAVRDDVRENV